MDTPSTESCFDPSVQGLAPILWPEAKVFLKDLVGENSYSFHPEGVRRNAERIRRQFAPMKFAAVSRPSFLEGTAEHLILDSGGEGPAIVLVSHLDEVYTPAEQGAGYSGWQEEAGRLVGPGIYDIKGGTVAMWMLVRSLMELDPERFTSFRWILAWNAAEEQLAQDFSEWVIDYVGKSALACLVFEGDSGSADQGPGNFQVVTGRKGRAVYRLRVQGQGSHSGNGHAEGANAILKLSELVCAISALTDYERGTTVNVGVIRGGGAVNRVPDLAEAEFEIRYRDRLHFSEIAVILKSLQSREASLGSKGKAGFEICFELQSEIPAWTSKNESELGELWFWAGRQEGIDVTLGNRGGLSDGNFFSTWAPTLDGLGPKGGGAHSILRKGDGIRINEFVVEESFISKTRLNTQAVGELLKRHSAARLSEVSAEAPVAA